MPSDERAYSASRRRMHESLLHPGNTPRAFPNSPKLRRVGRRFVLRLSHRRIAVLALPLRDAFHRQRSVAETLEYLPQALGASI